MNRSRSPILIAEGMANSRVGPVDALHQTGHLQLAQPRFGVGIITELEEERPAEMIGQRKAHEICQYRWIGNLRKEGGLRVPPGRRDRVGAFVLGQRHADRTDPPSGILAQPLGRLAVHRCSHRLRQFDDLSDPEQQFPRSYDVHIRCGAGHRLDRMTTPTAHTEMEVSVPFDQEQQSGQDPLIHYILEVIDDQDERLPGQAGKQSLVELVEAVGPGSPGLSFGHYVHVTEGTAEASFKRLAAIHRRRRSHPDRHRLRHRLTIEPRRYQCGLARSTESPHNCHWSPLTQAVLELRTREEATVQAWQRPRRPGHRGVVGSTDLGLDHWRADATPCLPRPATRVSTPIVETPLHAWSRIAAGLTLNDAAMLLDISGTGTLCGQALPAITLVVPRGQAAVPPWSDRPYRADPRLRHDSSPRCSRRRSAWYWAFGNRDTGQRRDVGVEVVNVSEHVEVRSPDPDGLTGDATAGRNGHFEDHGRNRDRRRIDRRCRVRARACGRRAAGPTREPTIQRYEVFGVVRAVRKIGSGWHELLHQIRLRRDHDTNVLRPGDPVRLSGAHCVFGQIQQRDPIDNRW